MDEFELFRKVRDLVFIDAAGLDPKAVIEVLTSVLDVVDEHWRRDERVRAALRFEQGAQPWTFPLSLRKDNLIVDAHGVHVGSAQRLKIGGYQIQLIVGGPGTKSISHYRNDIVRITQGLVTEWHKAKIREKAAAA